MAVHVPLSDEAVKEARELMLSSVNLLKPSSGEPIVGPSKDMVLGCYYLTVVDPNAKGAGKIFGSSEEVRLAYDLGVVGLRAPITVRFTDWADEVALEDLGFAEDLLNKLEARGMETAGDVVRALNKDRAAFIDELDLSTRGHEDLRAALLSQHVRPDKVPQTGMLSTSVGRVLFNMSLPKPLQFVDDVMDKKRLNDFVGVCYELMGSNVTAEVVDEIKRMGFTYATVSGMTIAVSTSRCPTKKHSVLEETSKRVEETERQYRRGLITEEEQYNKVVELWTRATDEITQAVKGLLNPLTGLGAMATSGATKGGIQPIRQLAGMRGLMADPSGRIIACRFVQTSARV
jgi:DNA-directed RNA polymerase subunit beta'